MAELPTQYTNRNVSSITDHSRTNSDTLSTDPALEHQPAALDGGNLEKGGSNSSASPGIGARLKGLLPTKARRQNFTWKHYTLYALVLLVPIIIIALALGLTLGRKHKTPFRSTLPPVEVDLGYTQYQGAMLPSGINQWLGMRYAAPPLGELRFKAPQDPPKARKQSAIEHGALCHSTPTTSLDPKNSEDCLFIDVSAPANATTLLPVYFFIQGGGLNTLSNPNPPPRRLIQASNFSIVVVSFNYRVGPWGFLASKEVQENGDLNVGLLDQRKALEWVQKYIHLFGGDPKHVTIDGDSAGAGAVDLHLTAFGGRDDGLFHAAIGQSNSFGAQMTVAESQYQYDGLVNRTGCATADDTLDCLRKLDVTTIAENNINMVTPGGKNPPLFMYSNVIDGPGGFTEDYTYNLFAAGKFIKIPTMFGSVTNEGTIFTPPELDTVEDMNDFLKDNWVKLTSAELAKIDQLYPQNKTAAPDKGAYWRTAAEVYGQFRYNCPGIYMNEMIRNYTDGTFNWHYQWDVLNSRDAISGLGVEHVGELGSIWGGGTPTERPLVPTIQGYWTSFIRSKDPNTYRKAGSAVWGNFGTSMSRLRFPNDPSKVGMEKIDPGLHAKCQYFASIGNLVGN